MCGYPMSDCLMLIPLLLMQATAEQFWPTTGAGWIALITGVSALFATAIGGIISYGKVLEKINGLGSRTRELEEWKSEEEGRELEKTLAYERMVNAQSVLLEAIGRAQAQAEQCGVDTEKFAERIERSIAQFRQEWNDAERKHEGRMARIETEISHLRDQGRPSR